MLSCRRLSGTASLVSHHPLEPEQLISGSLIIRNSIFAQNPRNFACDRIFLAHTFTSIPKMKFLRFQCPAILRHDDAKCRTQAVMAYPSHSSTVFCVFWRAFFSIFVVMIPYNQRCIFMRFYRISIHYRKFKDAFAPLSRLKSLILR